MYARIVFSSQAQRYIQQKYVAAIIDQNGLEKRQWTMLIACNNMLTCDNKVKGKPLQNLQD